MTSLLYYAILENLSKDERVKLDQRVLKNRESVHHFVIELPSTSKRRAKRLWLYVKLIVFLNQPLITAYECAVILTPPPAIHRLSAIQQDKILKNEKCHSQITEIIQEKVEKMRITSKQHKQFKTVAFQLNNGAITIEEAVLQLRGGDGLSELAGIVAFIIFINWYDSLFGVQAFTATPLPHQDPFGWLTGKYDHTPDKPDLTLTYRSSRFQLEMAGVSRNMCPGSAMADENGFVMSYEEARNLVAETYSGYLEVNESCRISDWQAAKHIYHAKGMGIDPAKYGFTQEQLLRIRGEERYKGGGLIAYVRRGYKIPPIEMIRDYQIRLKTSTNQAPIKRTNVPYYDSNGAWPARVFATPPTADSSGIIIAYNESTGDLITGDKQKPASFNRFKNENYLGAKKWMSKWGNK